MEFKFNLQLFAHKKGQGSSTNGRDSEGKRLGVKIYAGQTVKAGNIRAVSGNHLRALLRTWVFTTTLIFILALSGIVFIRIAFPGLPANILQALHYVYVILPLLGIGVALNTVRIRGAIPLFCGVFLALSAVKEFLWS